MSDEWNAFAGYSSDGEIQVVVDRKLKGGKLDFIVIGRDDALAMAEQLLKYARLQSNARQRAKV